ncbi:hypothetical protein BCR41DRAFT_185134 [Lobosporangium transversale]|uniref:Uncharacterized protein n=1 Tax=Lobosporangium transversale TaxID=64571 RepID=A0A1Y2GAF0_9FUNG|nr:hypothetical protein BCR41DRAFT_185134 [Lobosporangium transversale]ORZ05500.1 hypothetical protein BCR41DRAFT_185134 [Lobosporangium transversale]|eukprot:XP_021877074.1 hypothetical protein BCR41DRAFT_185134 [Lobosporangium transversale]
MLQEQRQLQEQQRKQQLLLQKQQQEAEQQAELLKQKLKKQRELELEQEQLELQKKKQQQEMELKLQKQKEKEQQRKEQERLEQLQREKEEQEKARREKELKEEQERKEQKERQEREEKERLEKERLEKERLEKERLEKERLEKERLEKERLQKEQEREERERKEREEREKQEREEQERKDKEAREEQQRKEREEQLRKEREEQLRKEREEQEKMEREEREERERKEREEQERKEREEREHHKKQAQLVQNQPVLPLGSFTFNPDASLATLPAAFSNPDGDSAIRPEVAGPFGLDSLVLSSFPLSPTHYTGSFNPFSLEDEPLMRRPTASSARSYLDDSDYDPTMGHNRPLGPPIPGKPRQASRFGFAIDHQYSDSLAREEQSDRTANVQSMQDGFRALFPNVNISFGQSNNALPHNQHQQQLHSLHQQHHQPQHQLQYQVPSIPNHSDVQNANMWTSSDKQESAVFQRSMNQLNIDRMLAIPNPRMAEYHQQHSQQHNGPPGLAHSNMTPTMMKSPPPGLENFARWPLPHHHHQQQQQQQQFQQHLQMQMQQAQRPHQDSRLGNWTSDNNDPAIMSARISSSNISRQPLVETLQPSYTVAPGTFNSMGYGPGSDMAGRAGLNHTSSPLQQFGLGPKRMENYPPIKPNGMEPYPMVFGLGESPLMNTINSAASARAAKVKSDLLMGLNAGIRPDRLNMKDQSLQSQTQQYTQLTDEHNNILNSLNGGLRTGSPIDGNANSGAPPISGEYSGVSSGFASTSLNTPMISLPLSSTPLTTSSAAISVSGPPPGLSLPTVNSNNAADSNSSKDNDNNVNDNSNGGNGSTVATSYMNITGPNNNNTNTTKPIDIASMMSVLDFFGSSTSVAMSSPNNWVPSAANGTGLIGHHYQQQQHQQQHQQHHPHRPRDMTFIQGGPGLLPNRESFQTGLGFGMDAGQHPQQHQFQHQAQLQHHFLQRQHQQHQQHQQQQQQQRMLGNLDMINGTGYGNGPGNDSNGSNTNTNTAESTPQLSHVSESDVSAAANARSVEDLELQVINAKMETQMLENQLNAVIKRNRRKLYA